MTATVALAGPADDLPRLSSVKPKWSVLLSRALTLAMLGSLFAYLYNADTAELLEAMPDSLWFGIVLMLVYLALPLADWIIFRKLWNLPIAGLPVILGKRISNEMLFNYSGEVYFYLWARERTGLTTTPFGAIKDVNILSALSGNVLALLLRPAAYPLLSQIDMGRHAGAAAASAAAMLSISILALLFGRRLFTLPKKDLLWVFGVQTARVLAGVVLCALLWALAMPGVPIGFWIALSLLRLLVARLPLVPNKELLFAVIAVMLVGQEHHVGPLIALTSTAMVVLHVLFGGVIAIAALATGNFRPARETASETA